MLPQVVQAMLQEHLYRVIELHQADLAAGFGEVQMPTALERKFPGAAKE